jgi:5'-nucleotidase (lipoprotein e(P4) family)
MKSVFSVAILILLLTSCKVRDQKDIEVKENQDGLLFSVLWFQKSAEMQALYYQGYNIAKSSLLEKCKSLKRKMPLAVIMDIDETILDNSPSEACQVLNNVPFSSPMWKTWVKMASAKPLPGALEFTRFADSLGVEVFYVTNRELPDEYAPTLLNLRNAGFPFADSLHLVLKKDVSSKDERRKSIAEKYEIVLLIGDNLADLDSSFDNRDQDLGFTAVVKSKNQFGKKFIVLPNPMYGPWVSAAVKGSEGKTMKDKILKILNSY